MQNSDLKSSIRRVSVALHCKSEAVSGPHWRACLSIIVQSTFVFELHSVAAVKGKPTLANKLVSAKGSPALTDRFRCPRQGVSTHND